jgi:hypothetical protein
MKNPFKASGSAVSGMFAAADGCDFFDHTTLKVGAVLATPIVAPVAFVAAFFQGQEKPQ